MGIRTPAPAGSHAFRHSTIEWEPGAVRCRFPGGHFTEGRWDTLLRDQREWYMNVVHACGYGTDVEAYAVHHDFCHLWLPETLWNLPSPTLEAVAHGWPTPAINRSEEYLVNTVQWVIATGNREYRHEWLRQVVGENYPSILDHLEADLNELAAHSSV